MYLEDFEYWYVGQLPDLLDAIEHQFKSVGYMPLWTILNIVVRHFTDSFYVVQLIEAVLLNGVLFYTVRKHCDSPWWFVFFYLVTGTFLLFNTEVLREGFAVAFSLVAIERYTAGKTVRFWFWALMAFGFHLSAIVIVAIPFLHIPLNRRTYLICYAIAFSIWAFSSIVLTLLSTLDAAGILGGLTSKIAQHTGAGYNFFGFVRFSLMYLGIPLLMIYFNQQRSFSEQERFYREKMTSLVMGVSIIIAAMGGFNRFNSFIIVFVLINMAELTGHLLEKSRHMLIRLGSVLMLSTLYILNAYFIYMPESQFYQYQFYFPYTTILDEKSSQELFDTRYDAHRESALQEAKID